MGKVLTTMQAGDFFGEIGILNLDGLNKRTADVRSVGYSELFSLSREDVLAAMKDYPEAQEILQTLGRKRLMEARKASAPATARKIVAPIDPKKGPTSSHLSLAQSQSSLSHKGPETPETDNTSKRIVEKLRSDVRGLRNAIRRSRKSNSSKEDSSEPESGKDKSESTGIRSRKESTASVQDGKSSLSSSARGVLKRMHHVVLSDEKERDRDPSTTTSTSPSSPAILAKRVQLPTDEEPVSGVEPEVIGAGLPLIQRLRLLKKKEEKQARAAEGAVPVGAFGPTTGAASSSSSSSAAVPSTEPPAQVTRAPTDGTILLTKVSIETAPKIDKESGKVSTNDSSVPGAVVPALVQRDNKCDGVDPPSESTSPALPTTTVATQLFPPTSTSSVSETAPTAGSTVMMTAGPSGGQTFGATPSLGDILPSGMGDSSSSDSNSLAYRPSERPSVLHFKQKNQKTYGSVDDLSPEFSRLPFIKKLKILNERQKIAELLLSKTSNTVLTRSTSEGSSETPVPGNTESTMHSVLMGRRTQSSSEQYTTDVIIPSLPPDHPLFFLPPLTPSNENEPDDSSATQCLTEKQDSSTSRSKTIPKPFICTPSTHSTAATATSSPAATTIATPANTTTTRAPTFPTPATTITTPVPATTTIIATTTTTSLTVRATADNMEGSMPSKDLSLSPPLSPEGNETPERRNLKSILKKLAEESASLESSEDETGKGGSGGSGSSTAGSNKGSSIDYQLLKAPTLEGYAARHSKFAKNVTFQRQAVAVISPDGTEALASSHQQPTEETTSHSALTAFSLPADQDISENLKTTLATITLMKEKEILEHANLATVNLGLGVSQEECIGTVFLGVKNIIQSRIEEIQTRFQDRFTTLETEVRQRDSVISQLQERILELELRNNMRDPEEMPMGTFTQRTNNREPLDLNSCSSATVVERQHSNSSRFDSDIYMAGDMPLVQSYLFSRGDSIDTVISNQDFDDEVFVPSDEVDPLPLSPRQMSQMLQGDEPASQVSSQTPQAGTQWAAQLSQEETIEMHEFPSQRPMWELEFHRDSASTSPPQPLLRSVVTDSVAVDIGSTSTDDNSSDDDDDEPTRKLVRSQTVIKAPMKSGVVEENSSEEDDDENDNSSTSSEDAGEFTNQNWEVQMLAKEMDRIEEEKQITTDVRRVELQELENEIREMRDAVTEGTLSPTELDMLEAMLETKTRRIKGLSKAYSTETSGSSSGHRLMSSKSKVGRSIDDFRQRAHPSQILLPGQNPKELGKSSKPLSPGERRDLQKLIFYRKRGGVKRQASLCEGARHRGSGGSSSSTAASSFGSSKPDQYNRTKRRESADSLMKLPSESKSFFSRLSFVRQLSRTLHSSKSAEEPQQMALGSSGSMATSAIPMQSPIHHSSVTSFSSPRRTDSSSSAAAPATVINERERANSSLSHKSSSVGILPLISSTISSALSSSVKSDPGTSSQGISSPPHIFTIPSTSIPSPPSDHQKYIGESQPLLKK
ncbi:unnamed protein product [Allacma fusca]|uniref:Cyclic nucleotide-binding domain-containing protein n=1 Tax=Allacma fusca TaxID=39272 RepID=A0A8J2PN90_9HEXA|nr:unnamed protein product [Allacma fusca]